MAGYMLHRVCLMSSLALPGEHSNLLDRRKYCPSATSYDCTRIRRCGTSCCASPSSRNVWEAGSSPTFQTQRPRKKSPRKRLENLVTVNRSDCNWADAWESQQVTTLEDLGLEEMVVASKSSDRGEPRADIVLVDISTSKAGWGFFVKGRILSSVIRQCNRCFCKYSSAVDSKFEAWLCPTRDEFVHPRQTGEDNDDPMVIYFPPGQEIADLTSMVRDTIRLSQFSKAICSEACKSAGARVWESKDDSPEDRRWSPLFEALRKAQT